MKKCSKCGEIKPLDEFHKSSRNRDGHKGACKVCERLRGRVYHQNNAEKSAKRWEKRADAANARSRERRKAEPEKYKQKDKARYERNKEQRLAKQRDYYQRCKVEIFEHRRASGSWTREAAKRRAAKQRATPAWADHSKINAIYAWAKHLEEIGAKCHVDHIVPLRGREVCGLHVHDNLRVVIDIENIKKHNVLLDPFEPCEYDMPGFRQWLESRACT